MERGRVPLRQLTGRDELSRTESPLFAYIPYHLCPRRHLLRPVLLPHPLALFLVETASYIRQDQPHYQILPHYLPQRRLPSCRLTTPPCRATAAASPPPLLLPRQGTWAPRGPTSFASDAVILALIVVGTRVPYNRLGYDRGGARPKTVRGEVVIAGQGIPSRLFARRYL